MRGRGPIALALGALCALVALERLPSYDEPVGRDVATYAVIAREMRHGRALYTDLWDNKPPALYVVYAAAQVVAGDGAGSLFLIGFVCAAGTALALFSAGAAGAGAGAGLCTAAFWTLLSSDLPLQANEPNIEVLVNASLVAAFAVLVGPRGASDRGALVTAGWLVLATLLKPVAAPIALALAIAHAVAPPAGLSRRAATAQVALILASCALAWMTVAAYFAATARWPEFRDTVFTYNRYYSGAPLTNLVEGLRPPRLFPSVMAHALPLALAALPLVLALRRLPRHLLLLGAWLLATPVVVATPGKFFPHYYQYWIPPLCLAAAWGISELARRAPRPSVFVSVAATAVGLALAVPQRAAWAMAADAWSEAKYGDVFLRARDVAWEVDRMIGPGEVFWQWGNEPEMYLYTGRRPPAGVLWAQHLQYGPLRIALRTRVLVQLSLAGPQLVVASRDQPPPAGALGGWFKDTYVPHPLRPRSKGFSFWVRRGGPLERRLLAAPR